MDLKTIRFVLGASHKLLEQRGFASPRLDAEVLLAHALGCTRITLYTDHDKPLAEPELERYRELVRRRLKHEPVAYLTGKKEFYGIELAVDPRVLIPRPETEHLVEEALLRLLAKEAAVRVADVATGSGAVAIALATTLGARAQVFASDVSAEALLVAQANVATSQAAVTLLQGDLGAPLGPHAPFDAITANLPYLTGAEMAALSPEVSHEPGLALEGGPDGLDAVRRLVGQALALLVPGGALCLEIGASQGEAAMAVLQQAGYAERRLGRDYAGHARVVSGIRS